MRVGRLGDDLDQACLADPGLARKQDERPAARDRVLERRQKPGLLLVALDQLIAHAGIIHRRLA
jgi:hypothetical protein